MFGRLATAHLPGAPGATITASRLDTDVVEAFRAAGWLVEAETSPQLGRYFSYPGPITMAVGRDPADAEGVGTTMAVIDPGPRALCAMHDQSAPP